MSMNNLPHWDRDHVEICSKISGRFGKLKILLKTKNETKLLRSWISHHSKIVGLENLIILDNMSDDQSVLETYAEYEDDCLIFSFSGFHNNPHNTTFFPSLYAALNESCRYFIFLDTDEFLTLFDGKDRFQSSPEIISYLNEKRFTKIFPATWLSNAIGHMDRFMLWRPNGPLPTGLKWGKPLISTDAGVSGLINHNTQIDHSFYASDLVTDFFVLHRDRVSPDDRIRANMRKLLSYRAIAYEDRLEQILERDIASFPAGNAQHYFSEIKKLASSKVSGVMPPEHWFQIAADGLATWNANWQREELCSFLSNPFAYSHDLLAT